MDLAVFYLCSLVEREPALPIFARAGCMLPNIIFDTDTL